MNKKLHVGLLVREFFGACGTGYGGYGILARQYVAKYLPDETMELDVILEKNRSGFSSHWKAVCEVVDTDGVKTNVYRVPRRKWFLKRWLLRQKYDVFLSIEMQDDSVAKLIPEIGVPLLFWIQDPRPWYDWREIATMKLLPETASYCQSVSETVNRVYRSGWVSFVTQGKCLREKAMDLYRLDNDTEIPFVPNPVDINVRFDLEHAVKKNQILFLGRIESVKRGWVFCEIAKSMPEYNFVVCGTINCAVEANEKVISQYRNVPNFKFAGHVDGPEKRSYLSQSKILVNTSIHEAVPVSFLEALSYGVCIVSNRNPDSITEKFGRWVGDVRGDGFEGVPKFVEAIRDLMQNEATRCAKAKAGVEYVLQHHEQKKAISNLRIAVRQAVATHRGMKPVRGNLLRQIKIFLMNNF